MEETTTQLRLERDWENPWFMVSFFCFALALILLWQTDTSGVELLTTVIGESSNGEVAGG